MKLVKTVLFFVFVFNNAIVSGLYIRKNNYKKKIQEVWRFEKQGLR